jgi:hypothetical protein
MGDIAESYVNGEVRKIKIPDVFLVKDLAYNLLSVSDLEMKDFIITIKNGRAEITKEGTVAGIASREGNLYKLNITIKEDDDSGAYSTVNKNNSKVWHTRMEHIGKRQLQQLAKIVDGVNKSE